jgi:hypothetical protein
MGGMHHSLALKSDGTVAAWGANGAGQCNIPNDLNNVVAIAGGYGHSLALKGNGTVVAWGDNRYGQTNVPGNLGGVVAIVVGLNHNLALRYDGKVLAWGSRWVDESTVPRELGNVVAIAAGDYNNLVLKEDGTLVAWGGNFYGQNQMPLQLNHIQAIAEGGFRSLALFDSAFTNHPPILPVFFQETGRNQTRIIGLIDALRVCRDPDGDTMVITAVSPSSLAGGVVNLSDKEIAYSPPLDYIGTDTFTYTVADARAASAQGTVTVKVFDPAANGPNFLGITSISNVITLKLALIPARACLFEASTNLLDWVQLREVTAGSNGLFEFSDPDRNFYRCRYYRARQ